MSRCAAALIALFLTAVAALAERPRPLGWAMEAMRNGDWDIAATLAARDGPVAVDVIEWHRLRAGRGTYADITAFLDRRPDWPGEAALRRRAAPAVAEAGQDAILAFYADQPPQTPLGVLEYAAAQIGAGNTGEAHASVVLAWRTLPMRDATRSIYITLYRDLLAPHHEARATAMLWARARDEAQDMFDLLDKDQVALASARIGLQQRAGNVDALIEAVPKPLQEDAGLAHDRFEWRIRKGRWAEAKALLLERSVSADALGRPDKWGNRRRAMARDEMREGDAARAYAIASQHFLVEGSDFADLEWLSGYIALRKLNDPELALGHFTAHRDATASPISRGRAGYWIGRAHEAMGNEEAALAAYTDGAQYQTAFYGLLAAERGGLPVDPYLDGSEPFPDWRDSDLAARDLFEAGMLLQASGEISVAERFWTHLADSLDREQLGQLGQAAIDMDQPHLAVMIGKRAARRGLTLHAPYYALHPLAEADLPMAAEMNLAIARRESEFDPVVQSGVGARGLMQIMPATAKEVAASLGRSAEHTTDRLTADPVYNAELGATFLSQLAGRFDGNVVLMSAAYNAGPSRPIRWMGLFGDPREGAQDFDMIDWIEHIPFRETQNYVMRVAESLPIYRARLGKEALPIPFSEELIGSTLLPFAPQGE
ncbi:lytic transglycosylase domain-containing protein [uncultured Tateyamaria sp.]|uniref:lytic transglycosylase domain-containing protein n=1 Tax=uncultured Tateyamaria sp. TaxID=455651 RepID=UPI00261C219B|nr:lytic transglycosylase domain-containing protein [uncultured Tateyamaria sp.]